MAGCGSAPADLVGMAPGENALNCLFAICPDPEACKPCEFDFRKHMVDKGDKSEKHSDQASSRHAAGPKRLPHRLLLSAFSKTVGHRPTGLQAAQAKMFVERFPSEFREMSMQKAVLPCSMDGLRPFGAPDGRSRLHLRPRKSVVGGPAWCVNSLTLASTAKQWIG